MEVEKKRSSRIALLILETYPKIIKGSLAALGAMSPQQLKRLYLNGEKKLNKMLHLTANEKTTLKNLSETNGYDTCDFSLLYKLIRHFDLLESPNNGWTKKVTGINNIGDVVESLRRMRNDTIHRANITFDEDEENKIFHKSLNIARITDRLLKRTTDTFEEDVKLLRSWDPEHITRDKYIKALEKITELKKLGNLNNSGYDIAIFMKKDLTSTPTDINGRTPLTIYVKSGGMISSEAEAVSQHLNEIKDMINNKAYDIVFDSAETGSVIIHIAINNSILMNDVIMEQEMRDFVERVFAFLDEEFLKNFSHNIECIFASSDTMFDEDDCEFDDYDENWLKLHVDVASLVQKDPNQLKNTVGQFVGDVFHATEAIHASDSPIEVHVHSKGNQRSHTQPMFEELSSTVESGSTEGAMSGSRAMGCPLSKKSFNFLAHCEYGDMAKLARRSIKRQEEIQESGKDGDTFLHSAIRGGHLNILQWLLERTKIDPNSLNKDGVTLLHSAVRWGHLKILQWLLERTKIDPNSVNKVSKEVLNIIVNKNQCQHNVAHEINTYLPNILDIREVKGIDI
ncbi:Hypothetical predicted protein [Mytilus galloprovincialis]|uniref:DZIP3-like HEPN domain-containing protein n=1 Tax=Mytilus galloprovincialis TaxID=29158 RepID=A0A8B6GEV0_MYTGA|nr:Hypothetical predicted protein [Mytilus galloprovincialis]